MTQSDTMFERYGGLPFVTRFVLGLYDRVLASPGLAPYFANVDMQRLVEHQAKFISSVMGGPASYSNAALREAHSHLHIDDRAFDEMIGLFKTMLEESNVAEDDLAAIMAELNAQRTHIVHARARL